MIREVTYYQVVCDGCGADAQEGSDYSAWAQVFAAIDEAEDSGWLQTATTDGHVLHFCLDCQGIVPDDACDGEHDLRPVDGQARAWACTKCPQVLGPAGSGAGA